MLPRVTAVAAGAFSMRDEDEGGEESGVRSEEEAARVRTVISPLSTTPPGFAVGWETPGALDD